MAAHVAVQLYYCTNQPADWSCCVTKRNNSALQRWLGVDVAVKELHASSPAASAEMYTEAETLASLRHPCIIAFYGVVVNCESPAEVMEYVRGGSLRNGLAMLKVRLRRWAAQC